MADDETDEIYAKIMLVPIRRSNEPDYDDDGFSGSNGSESPEKPASFAKTLTHSDVNKGAGFSVPRYGAETLFPQLDYSADPPVQTLILKDVHGEIWKFKHIYRGTPRRHLLTAGWSTFVNQKKLVVGDSIVFIRGAENGDLCVGIRRAKRGNCAGSDGDLDSGGGLRGRGRVRPEVVAEAASVAANGQPFEVVYYPMANTPEFCIMASSVRDSMRNLWCSGIRFKIPFETEDSSQISWFAGTIASVQVAEPIRWPKSPWRLL